MDSAPREDEDAREYIARMHGKGRGCTCPLAYSMCKWGVIYDAFHGRVDGNHGGWGWAGPIADAAKMREALAG